MASFFQKLNPFASLKQQVNDLSKQLRVFKRAEAPASADRNTSGSVTPLYPFSLDTIYSLAYMSDILGIIHRALRIQMFKNGLECIKSEDTDEAVLDVDEDRGEPDDKDRQRVLNFTQRCNESDEELI